MPGSESPPARLYHSSELFKGLVPRSSRPSLRRDERGLHSEVLELRFCLGCTVPRAQRPRLDALDKAYSWCLQYWELVGKWQRLGTRDQLVMEARPGRSGVEPCPFQRCDGWEV